MPASGSLLLTGSSDEAFHKRAEATMAAHGWATVAARDSSAIVQFVSQLWPATLFIDATNAPATAIATAIRALPAPHNGTPIITAGGETSLVSGAGGHLHTGWGDTDLLTLLHQWAGPLDDHALRAEPWNFRYRLIRLIGLDAADRMLLRFRDSLSQAVERPDGHYFSPHRIAGIAGMCGFAELSRAWSAVDRGEVDHLSAALDGSREVIAQIDGALRDG